MRSILTEIKTVFGFEKPSILIPIPKRPDTMRDTTDPVYYQGSDMSFVGYVEITEVKK